MTTSNNKATPHTTGALIRGTDYLARHPGFELVGREEYLEKLTGILMQKKARSIILSGPGGVGLSALTLGLQASKDKEGAPFDIVNKRIFWLDTDTLFASGDSAEINTSFQKIMKTLSRDPDTVLVLEDTKDFIEAARNNGCTHFINALTQHVRTGKFQTIFETRDEDLDMVFKCHSDMREFYTLLDVEEPSPEDQKKIVANAALSLTDHHGIKVDAEAIEEAIALTNKYRVRDPGLSRAQPERSITLLDRALTAYRLEAHKNPPGLEELTNMLGLLNKAENTGELAPELEGMSEKELANLRTKVESDLAEKKGEWTKSQDALKKLYGDQREGEELIRSLEDKLESQLAEEAEARERAKANGDIPDMDNTVAGQAVRSKTSMFEELTSQGGLNTPAVRQIKQQIAEAQKLVDENKAKFAEMAAEINKDLHLTRDMVQKEFGSISGIPLSKLNQNEKDKLVNLEETLSGRVFGQPDAIERLSNAVITARVGRRKGDKPQAAFMFLGPSGVGKTEIAKALTAALNDDEETLLRFDMSEYMEKHAVAKLIGAPPGYEGFDVGGILTNAMRRNPNRIILFDEIEKAHPDVFNIFLQILSDGRLTDNVGRTVRFGESIILMTTNTGQPHFLNPNLSFEEAKVEAIDELNKTYRSELLNRFNGRQNIVCFNKLDLPVIEKIVKREIGNLNKTYGEQGLKIDISDKDLAAFCKDHYNPDIGARGLPGYIEAAIEPQIAKTILKHPNKKGVMPVEYDAEKKSLTIGEPKAEKQAAPTVANENAPEAEKAAAARPGGSVSQKFNLG